MVWTCSDEVNGEREPDGGQDGAQDRAQDGRGPNRPNPINDISGTRANQTSSTMAGPESPLMTRPPETACSVEHEHEPLNLLFDSMDEALNWRVENQLDRYFSFKGSKSTRGVLGAYRYLRCNQNVKDKIAGAKKSKKAYLCSARITFNQTEMCCCPDPQSDLCLNAKQQVKVYGCVAHSHPMGRKNIRLSKIVKDRTASLLSSGITSEVVIDKYMSINDLDPQSKPVTYDDIYRIKKSLNLEDRRGEGTPVFQALVENENQIVFSAALKESSDESASWTYFITNYGPDGRQAPLNAWARPATLGAPPHNLHIERYHRTIKGVFKPNMNIARFCIGLKQINKGFVWKDIMSKEGIRGIGLSKLMMDFNKCHPTKAELGNYSVERIDRNSFQIVFQRPLSKERDCYSMKRNRFPCNSALCLVRCESCPKDRTCAHEYTCTCTWYAYSNICKHIHILALLTLKPVQCENISQTNENDLFKHEQFSTAKRSSETEEAVGIIIEEPARSG
eukprot:TCALIF_12073-PA protein Name:"Protein of unknown function" AED:0.26 eAED:0.38 QI:20/0.2/0.5/0.83/1/0.66/6/0/505